VGCEKLATVLGATTSPAPERVMTSLPLAGTGELGVNATDMVTPLAFRTALLRVTAREMIEPKIAGVDATVLAATTAPTLSLKAAPALEMALKAVTGFATPDIENDTGCPPLKVPPVNTTVSTDDIMLAVAVGEPEAGRANVTAVELSAGHAVGVPDNVMMSLPLPGMLATGVKETNMVTLEPTVTRPPSASDAEPAEAKSCVVDTVMPAAVPA